MDVLIVGYGKIGDIKARIWQSLGRRVVVYDVDADKLKQAQMDGFEVFDDPAVLREDLIVDISTPATFHLESLTWALSTLKSLPQAFLIEKPLASNPDELLALEALLSNEASHVKDKIMVNESYYLSSALKYVTESINKNRQNIQSINIELSKNRLEDVSAGRFTDPHLGTFGIELPHMIALLQGLGIDLKNTAVEKVSIFKVQENNHNEGFKLKINHKGTSISLESYLGDFRVGEHDSPLPNEEIVRSLKVVTNQASYRVEFDPVSGLERYKSRVSKFDKQSKLAQVILLDDNHLASHLNKLHLGHQSELHEYFTVQNALDISQFIFALKDQADYVFIDSIPITKTNALTNVSTAS